MVALYQIGEPGVAGLDRDGVAVEVGEGADGRVLVNHNPLGVALHGGGYGYERLAVGHRLQGPIRRSHTKLCRAHRHLLFDDRIRTARLDGNVESLFLVISLGQCSVETTMLGLRVPVRLQSDFS